MMPFTITLTDLEDWDTDADIQCSVTTSVPTTLEVNGVVAIDEVVEVEVEVDVDPCTAAEGTTVLSVDVCGWSLLGALMDQLDEDERTAFAQALTGNKLGPDPDEVARLREAAAALAEIKRLFAAVCALVTALEAAP